MNLQTPIIDAGRVFKMFAGRLAKLNIFTLEDFLYHIPSRYENYSLISKIGQVQPGEIVTIQGRVVSLKNTYLKGGFKTIQKVIVADETGEIELTWFNQPYLTRNIREGDLLSVSGRVEEFHRKFSMVSPEHEVLALNHPSTTLRASAKPDAKPRTIHTGRLVPIYSETKGVSSKWLRKQVHNLLTEFGNSFQEYLPLDVLDKNNFVSFSQAISQIHFPDSLESATRAKERLAFDELLTMQLNVMHKKSEWQKTLKGNAFAISGHKNKIDAFWEALPFELTSAQRRAVTEIFKDLSATEPMNRLLQGDVGSGKTVVATIAMYIAYLNGYQSVLMAPTEILAGQHYTTVTKLLEPLGVKVNLVTRSHKLKRKSVNGKEARIDNRSRQTSPLNQTGIVTDKRSAPFDILVGTHAVLSKNVEFKKLGLVVIDEQQRFGVEQRGIIRTRGKNPHLLTMTATPIPRTVALTLYGDLDLSYLDEMPKGRQTIKTWLVPSYKRDAGYAWMRKEIKESKSQAFIICPFIEESESMQTVKAATKEYERLKSEVFPDLKIGLLHGRLKGKEKDAVLQDFREKKYDILVATPVVEVGIDIPNATIMLIEASERFGLAQLHQLRGRVGRGSKQSYCLLYTESKNDQTLQRLKAMESMQVGAELAELDLKLRGPGELYGVMQSGRRSLKIASFSDIGLIEKAKKAAEELYPHLSKYPQLQQKLEPVTTKVVSPD